jgi:hypothetical protein
MFRRLAAVAAVATAALAAVPAAHASQAYDGRGLIGPVEMFEGRCTWQNFDKVMDIASPAPRIYARNVTRGAGNDFAFVRWRVDLTDYYGRVTRRYPVYSQLGLAMDNRPATFNTLNMLQEIRNVPRFSKLVVYVEWRTGRNNARSGWATYRVPSYSLTQGGVGPYRGLEACSEMANQPGA